MKKNEEIKADGYTLAEILGREKTIALLGHDTILIEVEERSAPMDFSGSTLARHWYLEVKNRNCKSTDFDSDLLEYKKFKGIQNVDPDGNYYYLCFFTDGVARLYHLNKIRIQDVYVGMFYCPDSTVEDKGNTLKLCFELPTKLAKTMKY